MNGFRGIERRPRGFGFLESLSRQPALRRKLDAALDAAGISGRIRVGPIFCGAPQGVLWKRQWPLERACSPISRNSQPSFPDFSKAEDS